MDVQTLLLFIAGFFLLVGGAELLVRGAARLAVAIGISPLVVGLTVVAYGTSAPELAVAIRAMYATPPRPDLAIGNVVGSNISNVLLVLGIAALARPLIVQRQLVRSNVPFMIIVSAVVWIMSLDGEISRPEGFVLFAGAVIYSVLAVVRSRQAVAVERALDPEAPPVEKATVGHLALQFAAIIAGLIMLVLGAQWLVEGATVVAKLLQVSELVIGLTVVAIGTSLPEVATSLVAGIRGHGDIAVGNVVGSNIFNLLLVLGFAALIAPIPVQVKTAALRFDIPIMTAVALACWPIFYTNWRIARWEGALFLAYYVAYAVFLFLKATDHDSLQQYDTAMKYFILPITALVLVVLAVKFRYHESTSSTPTNEDSQDAS